MYEHGRTTYYILKQGATLSKKQIFLAKNVFIIRYRH